MNTTTIFALICTLLFVGVLIVKYRKYSVQRALKLPKNPPEYPDSSIRSAKAIGQFLFTRAETCGVYYMSADRETGVSYQALKNIANGKDEHIINLIRMSHYLGCEIVVRQIGTEDLEDPATTTQAYSEMIFRIEEENRR